MFTVDLLYQNLHHIAQKHAHYLLKMISVCNFQPKILALQDDFGLPF